MHPFSEELLKWYEVNKRELPWRSTTNPYKIWLSEIILQQTRVEQGMDYYLAFVETYPTVHHLAKASEQEVLKMWEGLGYYSRARNLHFTAKYIQAELKGIFPKTYAELLSLKGVGKYTAAAIASFAYGEAVPAIDGNVYRVLSRVFAEYEIINTSRAEKLFRELAMQLLPKDDAGGFNQAMMELGAIVCKPKNPNCQACPVAVRCWAKAEQKQTELPVKKSAIKVRNRYFHYFILTDEQQILLKKREGKDVWKHLYEFPLLEKEAATLADCSVFLHKELGIQTPTLRQFNPQPTVHKLSHQHLHITFWEVSGIVQNQKNYTAVSKLSLSDYPMPIVLAKFIASHLWD